MQWTVKTLKHPAVESTHELVVVVSSKSQHDLWRGCSWILSLFYTTSLLIPEPFRLLRVYTHTVAETYIRILIQQSAVYLLAVSVGQSSPPRAAPSLSGMDIHHLSLEPRDLQIKTHLSHIGILIYLSPAHRHQNTMSFGNLMQSGGKFLHLQNF